ncbi:MAG: hypothetical protein MK086_05705 [Flavobacteriales bacterium]|nr:hypothetical protein [Flavobacteriales bacterium]
MSDSQLNKLEEKYWNGETSLEEERLLKNAASQKDPALSREIVDLFKACEDETMELKLDESFDQEFWSKVEDQPRVIKGNFGTLNFIRYAAAAVVIFCLSATIWYSLGDSSSESQMSASSQEKFESPEEAFEEAKKALSFASAKMNKAKKPVRKIEKFHQATLSVSGMD